MLMIIITVKIELYASLIDDTIPIKDDANNKKTREYDTVWFLFFATDNMVFDVC
jgi:hypothetical protein